MTTQNGDRPNGPVAIVIPAAGRGERLGGAMPKALEEISGEALLTHVLRQISTLSETEDIAAVVVAAPLDYVDEVFALCEPWTRLACTVIGGARTRQGSVNQALVYVPPESAVVLVHDAARALTPASVFIDVIAAVRGGNEAVIPGIPVSDTIKVVDDDNIVERTVNRTPLRAIQTPQGFTRAMILRAHNNSGGMISTDEAGLVERLNEPVTVIPGHPEAFKVTTQFDISIAEAVLRGRAPAPRSRLR